MEERALFLCIFVFEIEEIDPFLFDIKKIVFITIIIFAKYKMDQMKQVYIEISSI